MSEKKQTNKKNQALELKKEFSRQEMLIANKHFKIITDL